MKFDLAIKRVNQLKANGHPNAGIYNPGDPDPDPNATPGRWWNPRNLRFT